MRRTVTILCSAIALLATGVVAGLAAGGSGTVDPPPRIAFVANGVNPADALAAGGVAGQLGAPLFTTPADSLADETAVGLSAYEAELIIVLGGSVAISDDVVSQIAATTGLSPTTDVTPDGGIVRVAGENRYATAAAVADLLAAYDPAYLPVDATALGAVAADTALTADRATTADRANTAVTAGNATNATNATNAGNADTVDGLDASDFARAGRSCPTGQVVSAVNANGEIVCVPDQQGSGSDVSLPVVTQGIVTGLTPVAPSGPGGFITPPGTLHDLASYDLVRPDEANDLLVSVDLVPPSNAPDGVDLAVTRVIVCYRVSSADRIANVILYNEFLGLDEARSPDLDSTNRTCANVVPPVAFPLGDGQIGLTLNYSSSGDNTQPNAEATNDLRLYSVRAEWDVEPPGARTVRRTASPFNNG